MPTVSGEAKINGVDCSADFTAQQRVGIPAAESGGAKTDLLAGAVACVTVTGHGAAESGP
ncbi:hypothetical protein [Natrinema sp. J7-1]|uniref:hypothetical protein n=1 Tax=Natrinema sp. J7-1 TaxID=1172566 RepID=UPI000AD65B4A|nr:hypothetical protein [Natrinema sp. J7-1]